MTKPITQIIVDSTLFAAVGAATYTVAEAIKPIILAPKEAAAFAFSSNPLFASPIAGMAAGAVIASTFYLLNLALKEIFEKITDQRTVSLVVLRYTVGIAAVATAAFFIGINPFATVSIIVGSILLNNMLSKAVMKSEQTWQEGANQKNVEELMRAFGNA